MNRFMNTTRFSPGSHALRCRTRRGASIILVMGMISVCLALSFTLLRTQASVQVVQRNSSRGKLARQSAMSGLAMGLRNMQTNSWAGVGTAFSRQIGNTEGFTVVYTAGDASLSPDDEDYGDLPLRVTLDVTGYSQDSTNPDSISTYKIRGVAQLVPRYLSAAPSSLSTMLNYTLCSYNTGDILLELPCRIGGSIRSQGRIEVAKTYPPNDYGMRTRYLSDLQSIFQINSAYDWRTVKGPVYWKASQQTSYSTSAMTQLGVATTNVTSPVNSSWAWNHTISTYKLYPGGPEYAVGTLPGELQNATLGPDPATNPLGIFYTSSDCNIRDNVKITGTLVSNDDINVSGVNAVLAPVELDPLEGSSSIIQLPLALVKDDFRVQSSASLQMKGLTAIWDRFEAQEGNESVTVDHTGHVICNSYYVSRRWQWDLGWLLWSIYWQGFTYQQYDNGGVRYFPLYMSYFGRDPIPKIKLNPPSTEPTYAWLQRNVPLYAAHPSDGGLRFELVDWTNNPD